MPTRLHCWEIDANELIVMFICEIDLIVNCLVKPVNYVIAN